MSTILKMKNISKQFGGVYALHDVNFAVEEGTVHALIGENGAGKSTLMNILSGVIPYGEYSGEVKVNDNICKFSKIHDSENFGISVVHQELSLMPDLSIAENIFIGNERRGKFGKINWDLTYADAKKYMCKVGLDESPQKLVEELNLGKQQLVEIAKALARNVKILVLDEPTSSLNEENTKVLLDIILELKRAGITIVLISHKLSEVISVSDAITVLRDGAVIDTIKNDKHDVDQNMLIPKMVGRELVELYPKREFSPSENVIFEVKNYTVEDETIAGKKSAQDVNFKVHEKEIVGFYGIQGAGRTELALSLFGNSYGKATSGEVYLLGKKVNFKTRKQAIEAGLSYVTEDRKSSGLMLDKSISFNTSIANLKELSNKLNVIDKAKETEVAKQFVNKMKTKANSVNQETQSLSGGNQQKVLLSRWLYTDPKVLILDEPTRGIDIGAKYEIYTIINEMVESGRGVIVISSELPELLGICDRIYTMAEGKIAGVFNAAETSQDAILQSILQED